MATSTAVLLGGETSVNVNDEDDTAASDSQSNNGVSHPIDERQGEQKISAASMHPSITVRGGIVGSEIDRLPIFYRS